jgi:diguanylate cyclase (GGDEF)-like protein
VSLKNDAVRNPEDEDEGETAVVLGRGKRKKDATAHTAALTRARSLRATVVAAVALALLLGTLATAIVFSQNQAREHVVAMFRLRGTSSATFVSTYLSQQAARERETAERFLAGGHVSNDQFQMVVAPFGSTAAVLLDSSGRLLDVAPADPALLGHQIATRYAHLTAAEHGQVAVSNVVPSAARSTPVAAVAVPFTTPEGRRVFSAAYPASGSTLEAFVAHTISYRQHDVYLVDHTGRLLAASPATTATTLAQADPLLARAAAHKGYGAVDGAKTASTFTSAPVAGTPWRLLIEVPNSKLYTSIRGASAIVPWVVFALVSVLGVLLVGLFARSLNDRLRLQLLSAEMERTAQTDSLTGLFNRRALTEHLTRAAAHARRRDEPLSVLMIDLDRFKQTNDRYGHEAGDQVLCAVADCMREVLRADDVYGRWGGDEFLVAMPHTDERGAEIVGERLRDAAAAVQLADIGLPEGVPLSVGSATEVLTSPQEIVRAADIALYETKAARREAAPSMH